MDSVEKGKGVLMITQRKIALTTWTESAIKKAATLSGTGNSAGMKTVMKDATWVQVVDIFISTRK